jgi:hypothetical protein
VRLHVHALASISATSCGRWRCPKALELWSLTDLREKLLKIGAKVVCHGRDVSFQMAEIAMSRQMFQEMLSLIRPAAARC